MRTVIETKGSHESLVDRLGQYRDIQVFWWLEFAWTAHGDNFDEMYDCWWEVHWLSDGGWFIGSSEIVSVPENMFVRPPASWELV